MRLYFPVLYRISNQVSVAQRSNRSVRSFKVILRKQSAKYFERPCSNRRMGEYQRDWQFKVNLLLEIHNDTGWPHNLRPPELQSLAVICMRRIGVTGFSRPT